MKNLVYQYFLPYKGNDARYNSEGLGLPDWVKKGTLSAKEYAKKIQTQYMFNTQAYMNSTLNVFESLRLIFDPQFEKYDNILLLDVDTIVNTKESIFDIPVEEVGMVHELGVRHRTPVPGARFDQRHWNLYFNDPQHGLMTYAKKYLDKNFKWKKSSLYPDEQFLLLNGGVQVWSKKGRLKAREQFKKEGHEHFRRVTNKTETPYLNMMFIHHNFNVTELPTEWNRLNFQWEKDGDYGKITHFNDVSKPKMMKYGT